MIRSHQQLKHLWLHCQGPRASPTGTVYHLVKATLCIGVYGNNGPRAALIYFLADQSSEDNDTEPADGVAGNMRHVVVSKRNMTTMSKLNVNNMKSSGR